MKKRVKCVDLLGRFSLLSVGTIYEVEEEKDNVYVVKNLFGTLYAYPKDAFEVVNENGDTSSQLSRHEKMIVSELLSNQVQKLKSEIKVALSINDFDKATYIMNEVKLHHAMIDKFQ